MADIELVFVTTDQDFDTYCYDCGQLRLNILRKGKPTECGNCKSKNIEVGPVGDPRLLKLRLTGVP